MRKKMAVIVACAAVGGVSAFPAISSAATAYIENFNSGDVTDGGTWTTGVVTNPANVSFTEPSGGPLTIGISSAAKGTLEGGYIQSTSLSTFNFLTSPEMITLTAPVVNGVQQSLTPTTDGNFNSAFTYLGVDPGAGSRLDTGNTRIELGLNGGNNLEFNLSFYDTTQSKNVALNEGVYSSAIPSGPNIDITSMYLYLDGATAGNFWIDFGVTWLNTTTNTTGSLDWDRNVQNYPLSPYTDPATGQPALDLYSGSPYYANYSAAQIAAIDAGYAGGVAGAVEVLNNTNNAIAGESVSLGTLSVTDAPSVPEPASLGVVGLGATLLIRRKKRQA